MTALLGALQSGCDMQLMSIAIVVPSAILNGNADLLLALGTQCSHKSLIVIAVVAGSMA